MDTYFWEGKMMEKIMKAVKSNNKKRGRNITIGAVVGMLLSCTSVMGAEIEDVAGLNITNDASGIKIDKVFPENTWNENTYINNAVISLDKTTGTENGVGVKIDGGSKETNLTFINNNMILSKSSVKHTYGIKIENLGENSKFKFINNGVASGESSAFSYTGYGVCLKSLSGNDFIFENNSLISGKNSAGTGVGAYLGSILGNNFTFVNNGIILGENSLNGKDPSGIYLNSISGNNFTFKNNGLISGKNSAGTGIGAMLWSNSGKNSTFENNGTISGEGGNSTYKKGVGVWFYKNSDSGLTLENNGLISAKGYESYGIMVSDGTGAVVNSGVVYGKTNAIKKETNGILLSGANNYGILISDSDDVISSGITISTDSEDNKIGNYGLAFTVNSSGGYKNYDTVNTKGNFGSIYADVTIGETKYTIRNVQATVDNSTGAITDVKSFKIENGKLHNDTTEINDGKATIDKVILNGIESTLKVVGDNSGSGNSLSNAIINAYGTAVEFNGTSGGSLSLTNTTVNGGVKENTYAILGSSGADTLVLKNTVVNGNIDMKGGKNLIEAGEGTTVNGNITTEGGDDTFTSGNNVVINGDITLGDETNANKIVLGNKVHINGDISTGTSKGVDFTGGSEIYLNGEVAFTDNKDIFTLGEKSVINKDIDMGAENDTLTIGAGSIVNGKLDGGTGDDTLTFGTNSKVINLTSSTENNIEDSINISHDIAGFENINVGAKVTFASDITVSDATGIKIGTDGTLTLRVDSDNTIIDLVSGEEKIKGHALYTTTGTPTITSEGGTLLLAFNKLGNENTVSFGDTNLGAGIDNNTISTTSKLHIAERVDGANEIKVIVKWNLPDYLKYTQLNKIYHGILSAEDLIGNFNVDDDEKLSTFLAYLNDIYAGNPYSYSSELSRKSVGMFRDIVTDNQFKANTGKWMIYGGLTHVDGGTKDTYYGKGYYTYDIGSSDMDADTKITGAYMLGEYGISDTLSSGVVIGGNKLKSDLSNGSKVDGSALYLGAYAKKYVGNLKVTAGAGFQYGDYDADRLAVNKVASDSAESVMKYSDNYNDITYDIYLNGRYSHNIGDNLFLEPYATLSYTYVDQDGANEGNKTLAIETDSKSFDYTVAKVGVDFKKVIPHEKGKSTLTAGVSYTKILDGADEEYITGRFKGGSDFDILVAHKNEHSIGLNAKYVLELENGVIFDVKGSYSVERDSHNGSGKNRTKGEWIVGAGIGYKF